jgi:hypothetical protein
MMTAARTCAKCGKPQDGAYRPFCSKRCADLDLHAWLSGRYAIPGDIQTDEDEAPTKQGASITPESP